MSIDYLRVAEEENDEPIELPIEKDGTMLLTTVTGVYPGACGLKSRNIDTRSVRAVRLCDGVFHPPSEGWNVDITYTCVFPKKRKLESQESEDSSVKTKRLQCSDLICLGLAWKATEESVRAYFEQFGEVVLVQLKKDASGSFKGFGFIRFASYSSQIRVLTQRHNIDGRWVDVRLPISKDGAAPQLPCKVFVGRCTEDITADDLKEYFSEFGEVTEVFVPRPFRAFGFVTFLEWKVAQALCGEDHVIKGVSVSVSSAAPKLRSKFSSRDAPPNNRWNDKNNSYDNSVGNGPGEPMANVNIPLSLVAAAFNSGLVGNNNNNFNNNNGGNQRGNSWQGGSGGFRGGRGGRGGPPKRQNNWKGNNITSLS